MGLQCVNPECRAPVADSARECGACGYDNGYPNVRAAQDKIERNALNSRFASEEVAAKNGHYLAEFLEFKNAVSTSSAIICMPSARLLSIASDGNLLYSTYSLQVQSEARVPSDSRADALRESVEGAYFPNYSRYIRFAALSLSGRGQRAYGTCSVTLKESAISNRATVFEYPLFEFSRKFGVQLGGQVPPGHRATWSERGVLATAKFGPRLKNIAKYEIADILLPPPTDTESDCVEVHIFGPFNRYSIQQVVMFPEKRKEDRVIQETIQRTLRKIGIEARIEK